MADAAQRRVEREAAIARQKAMRLQRARERSLADIGRRAREAVRAVEPDEQRGRVAAGSIARLRLARDRAPKQAIVQEVALRHGHRKGGARGTVERKDGTYVSTIRFELDRTKSGEAARKHQACIERERACLASFGALAETRPERSGCGRRSSATGGSRAGGSGSVGWRPNTRRNVSDDGSTSGLRQDG